MNLLKSSTTCDQQRLIQKHIYRFAYILGQTLALTDTDRNQFLSGNWLTDKHINVAQTLLKNHAVPITKWIGICPFGKIYTMHRINILFK